MPTSKGIRVSLTPSYYIGEAGQFPASPEVIIPPGFVRLFTGQDLKEGDAYYRHAFRQFLPFSPSQIEICGHVLACEIVIRPLAAGQTEYSEEGSK